MAAANQATSVYAGLVLPLVYPWSDAVGLCKILDDWKLWGEVFSPSGIEAQYKQVKKKTILGGNILSEPARNDTRMSLGYRIRRCFKDAAKRTLQGRRVQYDDDQSFGQSFADMLASSFGREVIDEVVMKQESRHLGEFLSECLLETLVFRKSTRPTREQVIVLRNGVRLLDVSGFSDWLRDKGKMIKEDCRSLCLFGCAYAVKQPAEAIAILGTLYVLGDEFAEFLGPSDRAPTMKETCQESVNQVLQDSSAACAKGVVEECDPDMVDKIAEASSETFKDKMTRNNLSKANEARQPTFDELNSASLSALSDAIDSPFRVFEALRELPYREVIRFASQAQAWLAVHEQQLEAIEELRDRLDRVLPDIRDLPWHEYPSILERQLVPDETLTIDKRIAELERVYCCFVEMHEAHLRLSAIVKRLGELPSPFISRDTVQLEILLDLMKSRIGEYSVRAAELDRREQQIGEFVGKLQSSDIVSVRDYQVAARWATGRRPPGL